MIRLSHTVFQFTASEMFGLGLRGQQRHWYTHIPDGTDHDQVLVKAVLDGVTLPPIYAHLDTYDECYTVLANAALVEALRAIYHYSGEDLRLLQARSMIRVTVVVFQPSVAYTEACTAVSALRTSFLTT